MKEKHLEMIENVIERMSKNCFQLKAWAMTLVVAVSALSADSTNKKFIILALVPIVGFWMLDSFYLQHERKYKLLYKNVAKKNENEIDYNMDTRLATGTTEETKRLCYCRCIFSITEVCFYPVIAITLIALLVVLKIF